MKAYIIIVLLSLSTQAQAGAWLQEQGQGEFILNYSYFNSSKVYDEFGDKKASSSFSKNEIAPYFEYGIHDDITIGGAASFQSIITINNQPKEQRFQFSSFDIFARSYLLKTDDYVVSIEPRLHVPVESAATINPEGEDPIPELKLAFGLPFKMLGEYSFVDLAGIYRFRDEDSLGNELKDMLKLEATLGLKLEKDTRFLTQLFHEESLGRKTGDNTPGNFDLTKLQLSVAYDYWETVFWQTGIYYNLDGVNTSAGKGIFVSTWYKF